MSTKEVRLTEGLLPLRASEDQPLERYVRANIQKLAELADAGFSHRALAYVVRQAGFTTVGPRALGSALDRSRRALLTAPNATPPSKDGSAAGSAAESHEAALRRLGQELMS